MRQRATGSTAANEQSSRSHMVFSLHLTGLNEASGQKISGAAPSMLSSGFLLPPFLPSSLQGVDG